MKRLATSGCSGNSPFKQTNDVQRNNNYLKTKRSVINEPVMVSRLLETLSRHNVAVRDTYGDLGNMKAKITVPAFTGGTKEYHENQSTRIQANNDVYTYIFSTAFDFRLASTV